jgi:hypothetical protein
MAEKRAPLNEASPIPHWVVLPPLLRVSVLPVSRNLSQVHVLSDQSVGGGGAPAFWKSDLL